VEAVECPYPSSLLAAATLRPRWTSRHKYNFVSRLVQCARKPTCSFADHVGSEPTWSSNVVVFRRKLHVFLGRGRARWTGFLLFRCSPAFWRASRLELTFRLFNYTTKHTIKQHFDDGRRVCNNKDPKPTGSLLAWFIGPT
jgi:hypothetical protein